MLNKQAVLYIHGFNSAGTNSPWLDQLQQHLGKDVVIESMTYDSFCPMIAYSQIGRWISEMSRKYNGNIVLCGKSLGGFWALYYAKFADKVLLLNPSLRPSQSLKKYLGTNINFRTKEKRELTEDNVDAFSRLERFLPNDAPIKVLLEEGDLILDYVDTINMLKDYKNVDIEVELGGSHQFENVERVAKEINKLLNDVSYIEQE